MKTLVLAAVAAFAIAVPAQSAVLLTDNFDAEDTGAPETSLINFNITAGTIDIVETPEFGITCAGGAGSKCLDLDGSPGLGTILTKNSYAFSAGDIFTLSVDASGSQRGGSDAFEFGFLLNGVDEESFTSALIASTAPFQNYSFSYTATAAGTLQGFFRGLGTTDNVGVVIDNVSLNVAAVPESATWAMMITGFGLIGLSARRRRSTRVSFA